MKNLSRTDSNDDDWTLVNNETSPSRGSTTAFDSITKTHLFQCQNDSLVTNEIISNLNKENRQLTEEWHRFRNENQLMAKEIKGARFLTSKMLEILGLEHEKQSFGIVMSSSAREDFICFQNLTKKLLYAVECGVVQKVKNTASKSMKKPEHRDVLMHMDDTNPIVGCEEQPLLLLKSITEEADLIDEDRDTTITVSTAKLPRTDELVKVQQKVTLRKIYPCNFKPAILPEAQGISK